MNLGRWSMRGALLLSALALASLTCGEKLVSGFSHPKSTSNTNTTNTNSSSGAAGDFGWGGSATNSTTSSDGAGGSGGATPEDVNACKESVLNAPVDCAAYCQTMAARCKNGLGHFNDQYPGGYPDACAEACSHFVTGNAGESTGNSLACRLFGACLAEHDPDIYCTVAGPGGDGVCGDNCDGFCTLNLSICAGPLAQYASMTACQDDCAKLDFSDTYNTTVDNWSGTKNTFACRMYWLMRSVADPDENCQYTKLGGASIDPCKDGV